MLFSEKEGLLFYVSGERFSADFSRGYGEPTFCKEVSLKKDEAGNHEIECGDHQALAWKAPGNIYAKRGTLSFFWRSRYPVGPTEFPLFRVGYADSTIWDATWLRIDYNGHGFDAMVTDINLSRTRVSWRLEPFPAPETWTHLALSWDEEYGIRFYVNGQLAAEEKRRAVYDAGLDQFGPHSRSVSNWRVINDFNFIRGGDIREILIYDRMLSDENVLRLNNMCPPQMDDENKGSFVWETDEMQGKNDIWRLRQGFKEKLPVLPEVASIRKVEIHDAYDIKRWYWKACDGIRETTWPGVHNRSRLRGRNDYFQLPDWDCYNDSGKSIVFTAPKEPFNWVEMSGSAHGTAEYIAPEGDFDKKEVLFSREAGKERTVHRVNDHFGGRIRFTNEEAEEPIGDFELLYLDGKAAPAGDIRETYYLCLKTGAESNSEKELEEFIKGRFLPDEQNILGASREPKKASADEKSAGVKAPGTLPFFQIMIPYEADDTRGLDGVELVIPEGHGSRSFSVQIKDPLWYYRNLMQVTFKTDGKGNRIWLDTRDRILPEGKCLYVTIACSDMEFRAEELTGWKLSLLYKSRKEAEAEHCLDRFTQVRDLYGHMVEEAPADSRYNMFNRFSGDIDDLMRVKPDHIPGQYYRYEKYLLLSGKSTHVAVGAGVGEKEYRPDYHTETVPEGIPAWAYKQIEYLKKYKYIVNWYIDHRQIEDGEFGGGLSDDGDFTCCWVGLVLMGCDPEKVLRSLERCNDAFYNQGMFTNGLCSIQTDELHSAEEGVTSLAQCCMAAYGNPRFLERAMENARGGYWITGINKAGHRHFKSTYFSGCKMAAELPWGAQDALSSLVICPSWYVARFNRNEKVMQLLEELAKGLKAHYNPVEKILYSHIRYEDDYAEKVYAANRQRGDLFLMYPAYRLTGNRSYYDVLQDELKKVDVSYVGHMNEWEEESAACIDKEKVAEEYEKRCYNAGIREYYNTEGSPWIDRVEVKYQEIQYDRLAGIGFERRYVVYPRNRVAWRFARQKDDERIAILSPVALDDKIKLIICNISQLDVQAYLLGGEMTAGKWDYKLGIDENDDDKAETILAEGQCMWARQEEIPLLIPAGKTCVLELNLVEAGEMPEYRYDLGICREDVRRFKHGINVTVHSLGHVPAPEAKVAFKDKEGNILDVVTVPPLDAPTDLYPKTWDVIFRVAGIEDLSGYQIEIDPYHELEEITRYNNLLVL